MKKYIDADRLKAEIERLGRNWDGVQELQPVSLFQADLYELLDIIDSLQQEQPEMELEKEFGDFLEKENAYVDDNGVISYYNGGSFNRTCDIYPIARYFFNLGLNARNEE